MLLGCRSLGARLGMLLGPSMAPLAPRLETSVSSIPERGQAVPLGCARTLFLCKPWLPWEQPWVQAAALRLGTTPGSGVLGWGRTGSGYLQRPQSSPGSDALALPCLFAPLCSQPHPALRGPNPCPRPQTAAILPLVPGGSQQVPGLGLQLETGAAFAAFPWHRHHRRRFAAALAAPGRELAPAGAAD